MGEGRDGSAAATGATPLLTLAIRHYNNAAFVAAALESALAQTYSPLEIVFVDDASDDDGFAIAERLAGAYRGPHRVVLSRNERNLGVGGQLERVLALSHGEIIVLLDADDVALPERCRRLAGVFAVGGPDLQGVAGHFDLIDPDGRAIAGLTAASAANRPEAEAWTAEALARERGGPVGAAFAFRRGALACGLSLAGLRLSEDLVLGFRCLLLGRLATLREALVLRRVHLDNISGPMRPSWRGKDLAAWHAGYMREKVRIPAFMRRDLSRLVQDGRVAVERARTLERELRLHARELKLLRVAPRLPRWRSWTVYFALRGLGIDWRRSVRMTLQSVAPGLAMLLLRRNAVIHRRAAMERALSPSAGSPRNQSASRRR